MLFILYTALQVLFLDIASARVVDYAYSKSSALLVRQDVSPLVSIPGVEAAAEDTATDEINGDDFSNSTAPNRNLLEGAYHFTSTKGGTTSVNGVKIHAPAILLSHYKTLLNEAYDDLKAIKLRNGDPTNYYHHRSGEWDIHIITAQEKVEWKIMFGTVKNLIARLPGDDVDITWARVGTLKKGDTPIGNVLFLPSDPTVLMDPQVGNVTIPAQVHVTSYSANGVSERDEAFNNQQFSALADPAANPKTKKRQVPNEILIRLANTLWELRMRPRIDPEGNVVEMVAGQAQIMLFLAGMGYVLNKISLAWNAENPNPDLRPADVEKLSSAKYKLGHMEGSFTMTPRQGDHDVNIPNFLKLADALNGRLSGVAKTYAMEGEVLGPDESGTKQEEKAKWELTAKANDDQGD
ncbi:MAG: hypothetical protein LQ351_004947 [Letrouitia transgressa]|nr:MAG: hypothetical protein LQ351_004947 [Letrouitia transgressa]